MKAKTAVITRSSDAALLQVARNTIWTDGQLVKWNPTNGFVLSWIPAARIVERGNASKLLDGFESAISSSVYLNWYHPHGGGGYEDVGGPGFSLFFCDFNRKCLFSRAF